MSDSNPNGGGKSPAEINTAIADALGIPRKAVAATIRLRPGAFPSVVVKTLVMEVPPRAKFMRGTITAIGGDGNDGGWEGGAG